MAKPDTFIFNTETQIVDLNILTMPHRCKLITWCCHAWEHISPTCWDSATSLLQERCPCLKSIKILNPQLVKTMDEKNILSNRNTLKNQYQLAKFRMRSWCLLLLISQECSPLSPGNTRINRKPSPRKWSNISDGFNPRSQKSNIRNFEFPDDFKLKKEFVTKKNIAKSVIIIALVLHCAHNLMISYHVCWPSWFSLIRLDCPLAGQRQQAGPDHPTWLCSIGSTRSSPSLRLRCQAPQRPNRRHQCTQRWCRGRCKEQAHPQSSQSLTPKIKETNVNQQTNIGKHTILRSPKSGGLAVCGAHLNEGQSTLLCVSVQPVQASEHTWSTKGPHAPMDPKRGTMMAKRPTTMPMVATICDVAHNHMRWNRRYVPTWSYICHTCHRCMRSETISIVPSFHEDVALDYPDFSFPLKKTEQLIEDAFTCNL